MIVGTIGTRFVNAILAFLIVVLNAHYLGAEKVGTISMIVLSVTIIQLLNNFVAGGALIYMTPRVGVYKLFLPAYIWTIGITAVSTAFLSLLGVMFPTFEVIPQGYFYETLFLALVMSLASVNFMLLLGLQKVKEFNVINLLQIFALMLILLFCLFILGLREVMSYFWAMFFSFVLAYIVSLIMLIPFIRREPLTGMKKLLAEIFRFGTYIQFANIFQTLNYRLSYLIVNMFLGRAAVGVLSVGVSLSEGLWLISRSISMVQYSKISNEMNDDYSARISLTLAKITWVITLLVLVFLVAIPTFIYTRIFGTDFAGIRLVIASLGIGIVTLSVSMIFSAYFSGINKPYHNTISSAIGLVLTIGLGLLLIPLWGLIGAGITATCSYTAATLYQFIIFSRITKLKAKDFLLTWGELKLLKGEMKRMITKTTAIPKQGPEGLTLP